MNKKAKKRLVAVGLVIVMVMVGVLAFVGAGGAATSIGVAKATSGEYEGKKVQVSGAVVENSLKPAGTTAEFEITGEPGAEQTDKKLQVVYKGALPATFGNGIVAICTGTIQDNVLHASQMVTKCPSKYESAEGALTVENLLSQQATMVGKETKLAGYIVKGSLKPAGGDGPRFSVESQGKSMPVYFDDALSNEFKDGIAVVLTGALTADGGFKATDAAIDSNVKQ